MAPRRTRNDFSGTEDKLFVKFLAKYNPTIAGRNGNSIYQTLVDNVEGKWPWAATHPWQSWRNRYVKDHEYFDAQIRRYQRKHDIDSEVDHHPSKLLQDAQGQEEVQGEPERRDFNRREEPRKRKRVTEAKLEKPKKVKRSSENDENRETVATNTNGKMQGNTEAAEDVSVKNDSKIGANHEGGEVSALMESSRGGHDVVDVLQTSQQPNNAKRDQKRPVPQRMRKRLPESANSEDTSFFESLPTSPHSSPGKSQSPMPRPARQPPRLIEGPFLKSLADVKGRGRSRVNRSNDKSDTETEDEDEGNSDGWPPRRSQADRNGKVKKVDREVQTSIPSIESEQNRPTTNTFSQILKSTPASSFPCKPEVNDHPESHPFSQLSQIPEALLTEYVVRHAHPKFATSRDPPLHSHHAFSQPTQYPEALAGLTDGQNLGSPFKTPALASSRKEDLVSQQAPRNHIQELGLHVPVFNGPSEHARRSLPSRAVTSSAEVDLASLGQAPRNLMEALGLPSNESRKLTQELLNSHSAATANSIGSGFGYVSPDSGQYTPIETPTRPRQLHDQVRSGSTVSVVSKTDVLRAASPNDPFIDTSIDSSNIGKDSTALNQKKRRRTFGGFASRRDKRNNLFAPAARLSLPNSHVAMSDSGRHSGKTFEAGGTVSNVNDMFPPLPGISVADQRLIYGEGLRSWIERMSQNHGFQEEVTWRLWHAVGDLREVDLALKGMREAAEQAAIQIVENRDKDSGTISSETRNFGDEDDERPRPKTGGSSRRSSRLHSPSPLQSPRKSGAQFTPVPVKQNREPEYAPPESSRAGKFVRLYKQGRVEEAFERVGPRVSLGGSSRKASKTGKSLVLPKLQQETSTAVLEMEVQQITEPESGIFTKESRNVSIDDTSRELVWGEEEDECLLKGNEADLQALEMRMGRYSVRQHTTRMLASLGSKVQPPSSN